MITVLIFSVMGGLFFGIACWKESRQVDTAILLGFVGSGLGVVMGGLLAYLIPMITLSCTLWTCH